MRVDTRKEVSVRFYGGGEFEAGVKYEAGEDMRIVVDKSIVPPKSGLKGIIDLTIQRIKLNESGEEGRPGKPVFRMIGVPIEYVKDAADVVRVCYPNQEAAFQAEVDTAKKLYNANLNTVILVSLSQGTSESYKNVQSWQKNPAVVDKAEDAEASGSGKKKAGRGRKAAKKKTGNTE